MRTRCWRAYAVAAIPVAARATSEIMVDDSDPGIEYRGDWVHNPWGNQSANFGGSVTFTNTSSSTAAYNFRGTAIAVFGAFEMSGTFDVHSSYSIDGGPATDFRPADTPVSFEYHQKFFQSDTLSDEEHTLIITNLEEEFWFDYLVVTQAPQPPPQPITTTTTTTEPAPTQTVRTQSASTAPATPSPSTTDPATTNSATQPETTQSSSSPSSQTQSTHAFFNTSNITLTSTDAAALPPSNTNSASQSQTSVFASGVASPTGSMAARGPSSKFPAGAIAGVAVGGLLVLLLVGAVGYRCRRRRQARRRRPDLTPYDPGLTALALEQSEKRDRGHNSDAASRGSTATSVRTLPLPLPRSALANATHSPTRASENSGERNVPHEIRTTDLDVAAGGKTSGGSGDRRTGFEPLGSSLSAYPLLSRTRTQKDSPVIPSFYRSPLVVDVDERRRAEDGGVRLAGGPPDPENARQGDDARSGVSMLPPAYRVYLTA